VLFRLASRATIDDHGNGVIFTPAAESHGLWPWTNAPALGRDVAPLGRSLGATGFARGAPLLAGVIANQRPNRPHIKARIEVLKPGIISLPNSSQ
jgi:hypothetical protein